MNRPDRFPPGSADADDIVRIVRRQYPGKSRRAADRAQARSRRASMSFGKRLELAIVAACREKAVPKAKSLAAQTFRVGVLAPSSAVSSWLGVALPLGSQSVIGAFLAVAAVGQAVLVGASRKLRWARMVILVGFRGGMRVMQLAGESLQERISEDPRLPLKAMIVVAGLAVSIACGLVLPSMFGVVPPPR